jgi:hypothetical protein
VAARPCRRRTCTPCHRNPAGFGARVRGQMPEGPAFAKAMAWQAEDRCPLF